jgi:hypothetical protein
VAFFETGKLRVISGKGEADLSRATINKALSAVGYDNEGKFFYITMDKVLFSDPASTIKTVLDAHGFVSNLENTLACLDTFVFGVYARTPDKGSPDASTSKVNEYFPCIRFELPQKNKVGNILQNFYDEIAKYALKTTRGKNVPWLPDPDVKALKDLKAEVAELKKNNNDLQEQVSALTLQLSREQKSLSRASRALDSQRVLPDNVRICKVERVDLKRRTVKLSSYRRAFDVPTHMLDRVPELQARCLTIFEEGEDVPTGMIFLDGQEAGNIERRIAELLYVQGDSFKARDSKRNEFQVKAVNAMEADTIKMLSRGMKVMMSVSEGYVVRFSVLGATHPGEFTNHIHERFIVHDIGRNQLVAVPNDGTIHESQG